MGTARAGDIDARMMAQAPAKLKVGLMLPYSGTYAALGANITDALKLRMIIAVVKNVLPVPEHVHHFDAVTALEEVGHQRAADVAGATRDQN